MHFGSETNASQMFLVGEIDSSHNIKQVQFMTVAWLRTIINNMTSQALLLFRNHINKCLKDIDWCLAEVTKAKSNVR